MLEFPRLGGQVSAGPSHYDFRIVPNSSGSDRHASPQGTWVKSAYDLGEVPCGLDPTYWYI